LDVAFEVEIGRSTLLVKDASQPEQIGKLCIFYTGEQIDCDSPPYVDVTIEICRNLIVVVGASLLRVCDVKCEPSPNYKQRKTS
jgi:hypothetical protein